MKKNLKAVFLLILTFLLTAFPAVAESTRELPLVCDTCGLLTDEEAEELESRAEDYSSLYGCEIILVTVDGTQGYSVDSFSEAVYQEYGYGWGAEKSGVLLLLSLSGRDYDLAAYGYGNTAFTDYGKERLMDGVLPYLADDDWYGGFSRYIELSADFLRQARDGRPVDSYGWSVSSRGSFAFSTKALIWSLLLGLVAALIVTAVLKGRMKSAVLQKKADNYRSGDLRLEAQEDRFLRRDVTRIRRTESSGGGRGTSVRSSGFSHRSGKF